MAKNLYKGGSKIKNGYIPKYGKPCYLVNRVIRELCKRRTTVSSFLMISYRLVALQSFDFYTG